MYETIEGLDQLNQMRDDSVEFLRKTKRNDRLFNIAGIAYVSGLVIGTVLVINRLENHYKE